MGAQISGGEIHIGAQGTEEPKDLARERGTAGNGCEGHPAAPPGLDILDGVEKGNGAERNELRQDLVAAHGSSVRCVDWSDAESGRCNDDAPIAANPYPILRRSADSS